MKKILFIILTSIVMSMPLMSAVRSTYSRTFTTSEKNFDATITLIDAGKTVNREKAITYRLILKSKNCYSVLSGTAAFYSNTDFSGENSVFLPNGNTVKINHFRDVTDDSVKGLVDLYVDAESSLPQFVYFSVIGTKSSSRSCVPPGKGVQIGFYSLESYRRKNGN